MAAKRKEEDFLAKELALEDKHADTLIANLAGGHVLCQSCNSAIDLSLVDPLSFVNCGNCDNLVFVPWEVSEWWCMRPLAAGGFGSVYLGRGKEPPYDKVVVKILQRSDHINDHAIAEFEHECDVAFSLESHPNLVDTYAVGEQDGISFLIQAFVQGPSLYTYIQTHHRGGGITDQWVLSGALEILSALQHFEDAGYLHRDVKPGNILVREEDDNFFLVDYGSCLSMLAAVDSADRPLIGSPLFMSPERINRHGEDVRSEIYSLGMMLYYMMMGETYFSTKDVKTIVDRQRSVLRLPIATKLKDKDESIVALIDRMIKPDRRERQQSYEEVREEMAAILDRIGEKEAVQDSARGKMGRLFSKIKSGIKGQ